LARPVNHIPRVEGECVTRLDPERFSKCLEGVRVSAACKPTLEDHGIETVLANPIDRTEGLEEIQSFLLGKADKAKWPHNIGRNKMLNLIRKAHERA
jgi:hypothetical protein